MLTHPQTAQYELALSANDGDASYDVGVGFIHKSLCIAGLPYRKPAPHTENVATFERRGKGWNLQMITPNLIIPDSDISIPIGVPYGSKARLLIIWLASQARQSSSRCIEIGPIKQWLRDIGVGVGGIAVNAAKEQLIKISNTSFNISVRDIMFGADDVYFRRDNFVESNVLAVEDLMNLNRGALNEVRWPTGVILTENAWSRFRSPESLPIPMSRLREIADSAIAIDVFLYLSYQLPIIPEGTEMVMPWKQYHTHFGLVGTHAQNCRIKSNAQQPIAAARRAYPEAQIDVTDRGLVMRRSRPADFSPTMVSMAPTGRRNKRHEVKMITA